MSLDLLVVIFFVFLEVLGVVEKWDSSDEDEADSDEDGTGFAIASPLSNPKLQMQLEQLKKFYDKGLFTEKVYNEKVHELLAPLS